MDLMYPQCAGLDVHQQTVVACARLVTGVAITHDVRTFGTTTATPRPSDGSPPWLHARRDGSAACIEPVWLC